MYVFFFKQKTAYEMRISDWSSDVALPILFAFFATLVGFDGKHRIYDMVWQRFPQEIRVLLANRYVFHPFWQHHNGASGYADWADRLERSRTAIGAALRDHDQIGRAHV